MPDLPHFRMPFSASTGSFAVVEQDATEEIEQCVEAACRTLIGSRVDAPGYGIPDETFSRQGPAPLPTAILAAVEEAEPRVHLLATAKFEDMIKRITLRLGPVT